MLVTVASVTLVAVTHFQWNVASGELLFLMDSTGEQAFKAGQLTLEVAHVIQQGFRLVNISSTQGAGRLFKVFEERADREQRGIDLLNVQRRLISHGLNLDVLK